ncbi:MAG TPA: tetratricopeptide repeat protein [Verrucomicrobiae bacterium]|jgi:tetratricopeptide (TPR) repeat protein
MTAAEQRTRKWLACASLATLVLCVYSLALSCTFVNLDDGDYVTMNPNIRHGLNWQSLRWAFTTGYAANWHPLTWISHIIDYQLYGLNADGHHLTNLLLHLASTTLLFLLLHRMTGALWRSAWVAAIFALHPLRIESVVWVAERKDVLSTFFWMLSVTAYVRCGQGPNRRKFYALALALFACGLMSKSMVVTLPFVLLLLDYWPLGRLKLGKEFSWRLVSEKIPFLLLAVCASAITYYVQDRSGVVASLAKVSLGQRLANVPVSYARYLGKIFWPSGLSVFYGFEKWKYYQVEGALILLVAITVWVVWQRRPRPCLAVGWFWFLGMLVPVIGLVQVGQQSMADRYSYLPSVGISIMVAWGVCDLLAKRAWAHPAIATVGALAVAGCAACACRQIDFWKNPVALFARAAEFSDQDSQTCYNVGCAVMRQGNYPRAVRCFERALKVADDTASPQFLALVQNNLGCAWLELGQISNAVPNFEDALKNRPQFPQACFNMGRAYLANNQPAAAVDCFQRALALDPNAAEVHYKLAGALAQAGQPAKAIAEYSQTLKLRPAMDDAANNLALLLATCPDRSLRDGPRAVQLARQASEHSHYRNPAFLSTLAAACAEAGQPAEAVATAQLARQLALAQNNAALAAALEGQLKSYQAGGGGPRP